jgi:hypothetical protein
MDMFTATASRLITDSLIGAEGFPEIGNYERHWLKTRF